MFRNVVDVVVENSAITDCVEGDADTLIDETVSCAVNALGDRRSVDSLVVASQTGFSFYHDLAGNIATRLKDFGVGIEREVRSALAFSNSQPAVAELAAEVEEKGGRSLLVALEPANFWPKEIRAKKIGEGVLEAHQPRFENMVEGLAHLTRAFAERFGISEDEFRRISRHIALKLHERKAKNPYSQLHSSVSEEDYDDPRKNQPVTDSLRLYDCCPVTNRGAALVISHQNIVQDHRHAVRLLAHSTCNDARPLNERMLFKNYPFEEPLYLACQEFFQDPILSEQGFTRTRLLQSGILELHNAIGPLLLLALVEAGFLPHDNMSSRFLNFDLGRINPSGGLLSGHPLAATFPLLLHFCRLQLLGQAGSMQVPHVDSALIQSIWGLRDRMSLSLLCRSSSSIAESCLD